MVKLDEYELLEEVAYDELIRLGKRCYYDANAELWDEISDKKDELWDKYFKGKGYSFKAYSEAFSELVSLGEEKAEEFEDRIEAAY